MVKRILKYIAWNMLEILFPRKCIFCRKVIEKKQELLVCEKCMKEVALEPDRRCFEVVGDNACYVVAPFEYKGSVKDAVKRFKFGNKPFYAKTFAYFINETINEICKNEKIDCIANVPLGRRKLRKRGYNQAEILAKEICISGAEHYGDALVRIKETKTAQSLKSAVERAEDIKGCFACAIGFDNENILLVDDICTTGVTLNECAKELKKVGVGKVICAVIAKTSFE